MSVSSTGSGAFQVLPAVPIQCQPTGANGHGVYYKTLDASRVVPTATKNQPRAWGSLACVYLGQPAS